MKLEQGYIIAVALFSFVYLLVLEFAKCFVGCDVEGLYNVIWPIVSAELVNLRSEIRTKLRVWKKIETQSFK